MGVAVIVILALAFVPTKPTPETYEEIFKEAIVPNDIKNDLQELTKSVHTAGTPANYDTAVYVRNKFIEAGIVDTSFEEYNVLLSYPTPQRSVKVVAPAEAVYDCILQEAPDPYNDNRPGADTYLAYSGSGNVTGPVVYANYGRFADFEYLKSLGVVINGTIVVMRYGKIFRGTKALNAETYGAIGVVIYSDPADDGFCRGEVYPNGPWRPETGVQRGTIFNGNGDPLTPGLPSTPSTVRLTDEQVFDPKFTYGTPLPSIPAMPLSWGDAQHLLDGLAGPAAPADWQGCLPFSYNTGPGPLTVNMHIQMTGTNERRDIQNVIAKIPGTVEPDRVVLLGNHRDSWTFGGGDPSSGTTTLLAVAAGLGAAMRAGWRPRRSIWLCSWDAEEYSLVGSVEFVEQHFKLLTRNAVVYINVDIAVENADYLSVLGIPSLSAFARDVTKTIAAPPASGVFCEG